MSKKWIVTFLLYKYQKTFVCIINEIEKNNQIEQNNNMKTIKKDCESKKKLNIENYLTKKKT